MGNSKPEFPVKAIGWVWVVAIFMVVVVPFSAPFPLPSKGMDNTDLEIAIQEYNRNNANEIAADSIGDGKTTHGTPKYSSNDESDGTSSYISQPVVRLFIFLIAMILLVVVIALILRACNDFHRDEAFHCLECRRSLSPVPRGPHLKAIENVYN